MISPKEKVRANIYKILLEEEKKKNKRRTIFSLTVFFVGITLGTSMDNFDLIKNQYIKQENVALQNEMKDTSKLKQNYKKEVTIDDLFQLNDTIEIGEIEFESEKLFVTELQI